MVKFKVVTLDKYNRPNETIRSGISKKEAELVLQGAKKIRYGGSNTKYKIVEENPSMLSEMNPDEKYSSLFHKLNVGDRVSGEFNGVDYTGVITQLEDIRKSRGRGTEGYIFHVSLNEPIDVFGVNRRSIRVKLYNDDSQGSNTTIQKNPSMISELELVAKRALRIGKRRNGSTTTLEDAEDLARQFHGREPNDVIEIAERENFFSNLAIIGELEELCILTPNNKKAIPIRFKPNKVIGVSTGDSEDCVWVCAANSSQIEFVDGDQELEFDADICGQLEIEEEMLEKQLVRLGPVYAITYFTDKHHLEGPRYQEKGTSYEHHFGEEGGVIPELWYDTLNDKILLVGGSYTITPEGIKN